MSTETLPRGHTARVMGLIGAGHALSHFYTLTLPPLFPLLKDHFGVGFAALGLVVGLLNLASAVAQVPAGMLVDRIGARPVLIAGMILSSAGIVGAALSGSYWLLLGAMVVTGLGNAVFHPADYAVMNARIAPEWMGRAFGVHTFTGNVGFASAPPVMLALTAAFGWRTALLVVGIAGLAVVALLVWQAPLLRTKPEPDDAPPQAGAAPATGTLALYLSPVVLLCLGFYVVIAAVTSGVQSFSVTALVAQGQAEFAGANIALTAFLFAAMGGVLAGGWIADRAGRHGPVAVGGIAVGAAALMAAGLVPMPLAGVIALMTLAGFCTGVIRPARDLIARSVIPKDAIGRVFGLVSTGGWVGMAVTPILFGYALDAGRADAVFWLSGAFFALAIVTVVSLTSRRRGP